MFNIPFIQIPFGYVLEFFYNIFFSNYGLALIIFSLVIKLILLPMSAKSKKSMMKMSRLSPKVKELEAKYGDDKQKYQEEVNKLYKTEGVSTCSGCLWSFIPLLLLFPLYNVIREPLTYLMHLTTENVEAVKTAVAAAQGVEVGKLGYYWQYAAAQNIELYGKGIVEGLKSINFSFLGIDLSMTLSEEVGWKFWLLFDNWAHIGGLLLPLLSGGINFLSMWVSQKMNNSVVTNEKGQKDATAAATNQTSKMMTYLMPLFSVYIGYIMPLGLGIYWLAQGAFGIAQDIVLTKHYRKVYDREDAIKQKKADEEAALEAERERVREQRRLENPDGIVDNTSKKKLQQKQKAEKAAAEAAYQAKTATKNLEASEESPVDSARPFSRGRAYRAGRYGEEPAQDTESTDDSKE